MTTGTYTPSPTPELGAPGQFSRKPARLRELKAADAGLDMPPLYGQEEQAVKRLESFEARLGEKDGKAADTAEREAVERDLRAQKSRARIEKLKDVRAGLELVNDRLDDDTVSADRLPLAQLRSLMSSAHSQLMGIYDGHLILIQGAEFALPVLVNCVEKLGCVQQGKAAGFSDLRARDAALNAALKAPNAVPVMEKASLLALAETVDRVVAGLLTLVDDEPAAVDEHLLEQHQPSLQLLQRAGRSQQEMLDQLTVINAKLGEPQEMMSLRLLKDSLSQLSHRSLRELQGIQGIVERHLSLLGPVLPLLKYQHERLALTATSDFLQCRFPKPPQPELPEIAAMPPAMKPMLMRYTYLTSQVVELFEVLTTNYLEKERELTNEGKLADLDAMLGL